jgi:Fe2+ or Zn2+ uptake regulation protein
MRVSATRDALLDWIAATAHPFSAETMVEQLVGGWGIGSRPTVYRTLVQLQIADLRLQIVPTAFVRHLHHCDGRTCRWERH